MRSEPPRYTRMVMSLQRRLRLIDRQLDALRMDVEPGMENGEEFVRLVYEAEAHLADALRLIGGRPGPV